MDIEHNRTKMERLWLTRVFEVNSGSSPESINPKDRLYFQVAKRLQDIPMKQEIVLENKTPLLIPCTAIYRKEGGMLS